MPQQMVTLQPNGFMGQNNALNPAEMPLESQRKALNAVMRSVGERPSIGKRDGSVPVTTAALAGEIKYLTLFHSSPTQDDILAASGTTLYKYNGTNALTAQTMTNALSSADIYTVDFTDEDLVTIMFITDGSSMKKYTAGSPGTVVNITPAADDALPNPANDMANVNAKGPKYCWVYKGRIFVSNGQNTAWYFKRFKFDYIPTTFYATWVRENDYINGCGVQFDNACFIPMRRGWGLLTGTTIDDFVDNQYLNTVNGVMAPRSVQIITYATGAQTIVYLSDDGVHEIFIQSVDGISKQYATRSIMQGEIDMNKYELTEAEKKAAVGYFDARQSLYILRFNKGSERLALVYDTRNGKWYEWNNIKASSFVRMGEHLYYAGETGHLHQFSYNQDLNTDWNDVDKTTGTAVDFDVYGSIFGFEFSGSESYLDYLLVEAKQWDRKSTLDVYLIYGSGISISEKALRNQIFVYGIASWDEAEWANLEFTDILNNAKRLIYHKKGKYFQRRYRNDRDEPVEIYAEKYIGRLSGR